MSKQKPLSSIELFTGAGGLALGVAKAGFTHDAVVEWNRDACCSLRGNAQNISLMSTWPIIEGDVRDYDFTRHAGNVVLLAAGAPCQPFSLGGKHRGQNDERNMFPEVFRAAREVLPPVVLIENVKGLLRSSFRPYFDYIRAALAAPEMVIRPGEEWSAHKVRLETALARNKVKGQRYRVAFQLMNAADYGVPQRRERVFIVAFRDDLNISWKGLEPTHSEEALLFAKWVDGSYWNEHGLEEQPVPDRFRGRVERLRGLGTTLLGTKKRWVTVRDALRDLPEPVDYTQHSKIANHVGNPGARSYPGHNGSPWDEPAKTLKAGDHGVPGGENMLRREDGSVRYFSVREAARIQTFPDSYVFKGPWTEGFRQLGNAVPVELAFAVASEARSLLSRGGVASLARGGRVA